MNDPPWLAGLRWALAPLVVLAVVGLAQFFLLAVAELIGMTAGFIYRLCHRGRRNRVR